MKYIRISKDITEHMPIYPGNPPVKIKTNRNLDNNSLSTNISMCVHNGTHIDFPYHYTGGKDINYYEPSKLIFENIDYRSIVEFRNGGPTNDYDLLMLRTAGNTYPINIADVRKIIKSGYKAVSVPTMSVTNPLEQDYGDFIHRELLKNDVLIIEDLDPWKLSKAPNRLFVVPLYFRGIEASPCTVIAEVDE